MISCPCALVVSIPLGYFGGIGRASRRGILVKGSNFIDALAAVKTVVFDKTGTLTKGVFNVKAVNVVYVINNMDSDVSEIDEEIKRLQDRKKVIKNGEDRLRDYLKFNMEASGISKITCPLFTITLARGRDVVVIDDESLIPPEHIVTTTRPDKSGLLKALKEGPVEGAHIEKSQPSLRIK